MSASHSGWSGRLASLNNSLLPLKSRGCIMLFLSGAAATRDECRKRLRKSFALSGTGLLTRELRAGSGITRLLGASATASASALPFWPYLQEFASNAPPLPCQAWFAANPPLGHALANFCVSSPFWLCLPASESSATF